MRKVTQFIKRFDPHLPFRRDSDVLFLVFNTGNSNSKAMEQKKGIVELSEAALIYTQ
jgi:hypothetical protein